MTVTDAARRRAGLVRDSLLFRGVDDPALERLAGELVEVSFTAGHTVFRQGEVGDAVYLVLTGTLALTVNGVTILYREPGDCVGEFALIDDEPRSTSAIALTDVEALRWDRAGFRTALARDPGVASGILRLLTGKLRQDVISKVHMQIEQQRWQQDLARATEIQASMLPTAGLSRADVAVAGYCRPAAEVGGDYYDYVDIDASRLGLIIADVTGHGFYSGLFVAMAKSSLHAHAAVGDRPGAVLAAMRRTQELAIQRRALMSCCYVVLDRANAQLCYANAGHPYPLLYRRASGEMIHLEALDPILGALSLAEQACFEERQIDWRPGDLLVLYSDGITECRAPGGEMFGHDRLEASVRGLVERDAAGMRDGILGAVTGHAAGQPQGDDLTLVVAAAPAE